ncbi:MAG: hypothetical protein FWG62_09220, partial [Proteobacteria bacterium]|nr:hypothetical protein [Pseudomonadota bacterium]
TLIRSIMVVGELSGFINGRRRKERRKGGASHRQTPGHPVVPRLSIVYCKIYLFKSMAFLLWRQRQKIQPVQAMRQGKKHLRPLSRPVIVAPLEVRLRRKAQAGGDGEGEERRNEENARHAV